MSRKKAGCLAALVIVAVIIGYAVHRFREFSRDMNAEYGAANTVGKIVDYVEQHDGQWPTNWDQIEPWPGVRDVVIVQFDVDIEHLIADPQAIYSTVVPATGPYNVYPHARSDHDWLRRKLIEHHRPKPKATPTGT